VGTDFNEGVKGIGPKRSLSMIREFKNLETLAKEERVPLLEWDEIREIFLNPDVIEDVHVAFKEPDLDGIMEMLVEEMEFGRAGVERTLHQLGSGSVSTAQASLDAFF
jgi:flap endonuclease-1